MKKTAAIFLLAIFSGFAFTYTIKQNITKSAITFQIKNLGVNVRGSFSGLKAAINFDPSHLDSSSIEASVQANTINTNNDSRDTHLKSGDYFDVDKYPEIKMKSVSIKHNGGSNYTGTFDLTIKEKTNQVQVPFTYTENGNIANFKGSFKIKRTDYGVGGKSMVMANDVTISIDVSNSK